MWHSIFRCSDTAHKITEIKYGKIAHIVAQPQTVRGAEQQIKSWRIQLYQRDESMRCICNNRTLGVPISRTFSHPHTAAMPVSVQEAVPCIAMRVVCRGKVRPYNLIPSAMSPIGINWDKDKELTHHVGTVRRCGDNEGDLISITAAWDMVCSQLSVIRACLCHCSRIPFCCVHEDGERSVLHERIRIP